MSLIAIVLIIVILDQLVDLAVSMTFLVRK